MKRLLAFFLIFTLLAGCLLACGSKPNAAKSDTLRIVTTIFPVYDWVMNLLGDNPANAEVVMLLDIGVDLQSFQPSAEDILKISTCDLFIYVGGESDQWVDDALKEATNPDMVVINLLDALGDQAKEEALVEGMQPEDDEPDEDEEGPEYDEHVWLSLKNAAVLVRQIGSALEQIDAEHATVYRENADAYLAEIDSLDRQYEAAVSDANVRVLLFGDRFPFRYLTDDYGLSYYAAFSGCSAETEASFETVLFLANKVDELSLSAVLVIDGSDQRLTKTVIETTRTKDQRIFVLNSMQSVTARDVQNGASYLAVMEDNLSVLKDALQ